MNYLINPLNINYFSHTKIKRLIKIGQLFLSNYEEAKNSPVSGTESTVNFIFINFLYFFL